MKLLFSEFYLAITEHIGGKHEAVAQRIPLP